MIFKIKSTKKKILIQIDCLFKSITLFEFTI